MSYTAKIVYISLGISLGMSTLVYFVGGLNSNRVDIGEILLGAAGISVIEVLLLLLIGFIILLTKPKGSLGEKEPDEAILDAPPQSLGYKERARSFFLAAGLVLLIGVSLCFGGFTGAL